MNSTFGAGIYPIVYTNVACGGWETTLADCDKQVYPQSECSREDVAGVLCGYGNGIIYKLYNHVIMNVDCNDGDLRLMGSQWSYEGTIEVCYGKLWGLISDSDWNQQNAEVVCRQLGYQIQGNILLHNIIYVYII